MGKVAAVFPGQGSQYVGMGRELADHFPVVRETFQEADDILGFSISSLCFEGPEDALTRTENTQPALLVTSVAVLRLLKGEGFTPAVAAGHSLGEYSALVAAGAMTFKDALQTVRLRGKLMEEAVPAGQGTMGAVLGLDDDVVEAICRQVPGVVEPATYNAPGQVVIAGEVKAVEAALLMAKQQGARRTQLLNVSGPFHSSLLTGAGERLAEWLAAVPISTPEVPVFSNVTAEPYTTPEEVRDNLARQVSAPVRWTDSVRGIIDMGIDHFVEIGPGRVLSGLIRRISRSGTVANVDSLQSFEALYPKEA